jgi:hypothetical protein
MRVTGKKLANADRRLLASVDRDVRSQQVKVPISPALWDVWGRYCEVVGISMGRGIAALIDIEVEALADGSEEVIERARLVGQREADLDDRERQLGLRDRELDRREAQFPSRSQLAAMADQIEPQEVLFGDRSGMSFPDVNRNDPCPCRSGVKFKRCHGSPSGAAST